MRGPEQRQGKLVVGANEFTALYLLRVLAEFRRLHPAIRIVVQRSLGSQIPDDIRRHNCEFGVLTYDPQDPELASVVVYSDELIFVVPPQHPLARESQVSIRQLGAESFVAHIVSSPYREKVIQAFEKHKTPLHMGVERLVSGINFNEVVLHGMLALLLFAGALQLDVAQLYRERATERGGLSAASAELKRAPLRLRKK